MPKSRIIKEIVNETVDLETSLNRLFLLANDANDSELLKWTKQELQGYQCEEDIPDYRRSKSCILRYSGINGSFQVTNVSLQPELLSSHNLDIITNISFKEPIKTIISYSVEQNSLKRDVSWLASDVHKLSDGLIQCTEISQTIPVSLLQGIVANVKQRLIQELIALENKYGCLDNLEIQNEYDPENVAFWNNIHIRVKKQAHDLFTQNYYGPASERAVREVETQLREMFRDLRPEEDEPSNISIIIGKLLAENGSYNYCDVSSPNGKNYCKGFVQMVQGFFTAYRNPLSHTNHDLSKREAFELISLSSMIMQVLDQKR